MQFEVLGKPQGKQRARVVLRGKYASAYTPEETVAYENLIKMSYKMGKDVVIDMYENSLKMQILAIYPIPKSFSKKKKAMALNGEIKPCTKPDIDNIIKVVCDALIGVAYKDDTQIIEIMAKKKYGIEPKLIVNIGETN